MNNNDKADLAVSMLGRILQWKQTLGVAPSGIYVGIAKDPGDRLFHDHGVDRKLGQYTFFNAVTDDVARAVEQFLLLFGFVGGPGGGSNDTTFVYAYVITDSTKQ